MFVIVCVNCRIEQCIDIIRFLRNCVGVTKCLAETNSLWTPTKGIIKKALRFDGTLLNIL